MTPARAPSLSVYSPYRRRRAAASAYTGPCAFRWAGFGGGDSVIKPRCQIGLRFDLVAGGGWKEGPKGASNCD